ncbi:hypothetical protein EV368DRAFT_82694, partial [Lentinula lateritia]
MRPFGCDAWATLPDKRKDGKLSRQSVKGKLIGYMDRRGYRLWIPEWRVVLENRDVHFEEGQAKRTLPPRLDSGEVGKLFGDTEVGDNSGIIPDLRGIDVEESNGDELILDPHVPPVPIHGDFPLGYLDDDEPQPGPPPAIPEFEVPALPDVPLIPPPVHPVPLRRSARQKIPSTRYLESKDFETREKEAHEQGRDWASDTAFARVCADPWSFATSTEEQIIPSGYKQAMKHSDLWREPMQQEYNMLMEKKVWEL